MKIVHIITGLDDGGAEAVLFRLITFDGCESHIVISLGGAGKYGPMLAQAGVRVETLEMARGRLTFSGLGRLLALLRREQPHIVQTWMYHSNLVGGLVARLAGVKAVHWNIRHTELIPGTTGKSTRIVDWLCARLSRYLPKRIIACAHEAKRVHVANGYDPTKFVVIPNGYDVSTFSPDLEARARIRLDLNIVAEASVIGLVGRWDPQKDHANLISAIHQVKKARSDIRLVLAGTNCDAGNSDLIQLIGAVGLSESVSLLGRRSDVPAIMNALDLHVLSSSHGEAFPNVVAEAMACGTPCIVTEVGDAAAIVGDTGWSVPPRNSEALANAIALALAEQEDGPRWGERQTAARQRIVDEFSLAVMVARYREAWGV